MSLRPIKQVVVIYEDGSEELYDFVDNGAGYHRIAYTWEAKPDGVGLAKWGGRIETHEIFWTERTAPA